MKKLLIIILSIALFSCSSHEDKVQELAQKALLTKLKSPSTAKFVETKLLVNKKPYYIVYVSVDAQNSFGAVLRENYMVALTEENNKLNLGDLYGVQTCSSTPTSDEVAAMAVLNGFKL